MTFYLTIVLYIASVITALILMIVGKGMPRKVFLSLVAVHALTGIAFLLFQLSGASLRTSGSFNFLFLFYVCSGTCLCGLAWRTEIPKAIRYYLTLFAVTFPMFLFSPSMLVNFLLTTRYTDTVGKKYLIHGNYYLEEQNAWSGDHQYERYKLVQQKGIFHKTVARNIDFSGRIDSLVVLSFSEKDTTRLRGYRIQESFVSTDIDSTDVSVPMTSNRRNNIERRL